MENKVFNSHPIGIEVSRLVNKDSYKNFDHLIKCKICFNILVNPQDCEECGNTFCNECINFLIVNNKSCPFNCKNLSIKPSSLSITSFLASMKFHCANKDQGCNSLFTYLQVLSHDKECGYSLSTCPNIKCQKLIKRQTLEYHIRKECDYTLFKCANCESELIRNEFKEHVENCKNISNIFDTNNPIIMTEEKMENFKLGDMTLNSFMKMILFNIGKINLDFGKKFEIISQDIKSIKDDLYKHNTSNTFILENINSEIEVLNERISHVESGLMTNDSVKKMLEENIKETLVIRDSFVPPKEIFAKDPNSGNSTTNNSKNNSTILNKSDTVSNVKKVNIRTVPKTNTARSPNKSPVNVTARSPTKTYNIETECYQNKTNNLTTMKTFLKYQETILENLNAIKTRADVWEKNILSEFDKFKESIKTAIVNDLVEDVKSFTLETSLDNSNRIFKRLDEFFKKMQHV